MASAPRSADQPAVVEAARRRSRRGPRSLGWRIAPLLGSMSAVWLLHAVGVLPADGHAIRGIAVSLAVLIAVAGPWSLRMVRSLSFERSARIREQERAELAAHLHDSVLQTLALIQKRAEDAREVASLARRQERELRNWLLQRPSAPGESLRAALEGAAASVEELYGVAVEVVLVGEALLDARLEALVKAAREAMTNAAKFAGCGRIDLYAEVQPGKVEAFVRDRGVGFDPDAIPLDRRGVRDSIIARMGRHGGRATLRSAPGQGTEVELTVRAEPALVAMSPAAP